MGQLRRILPATLRALELTPGSLADRGPSPHDPTCRHSAGVEILHQPQQVFVIDDNRLTPAQRGEPVARAAPIGQVPSPRVEALRRPVRVEEAHAYAHLPRSLAD